MPNTYLPESASATTPANTYATTTYGATHTAGTTYDANATPANTYATTTDGATHTAGTTYDANATPAATYNNISHAVAPHAATPHAARGPVDLNVMKRNMTIAKGFLDISLLSANANQLKNIINFGDANTTTYYVVMTGIILSLILQVTAGVILIVAERFDINVEEDHEQSDLLNTVVIALVFVVLLVNVFVASFGVDVAMPPHDPGHQHQGVNPGIKHQQEGFSY